MILSNDGLVAFYYRSYGTFFLYKIGSIRSIGDLPTTNIIEPIILKDENISGVFIFFLDSLLGCDILN